MNTNEFYGKKGLAARKLRSDEIDEFAINLRLKWKDQEFTRVADRIWRHIPLQAMVNIVTPQQGKLEDEDKVLPIKEINKWCKRRKGLTSPEDVQEAYFSIIQPDPENAIEPWSPFKNYLPGELVQYVPEVDTKIWKLAAGNLMAGEEIIDAQGTVVSPQDAKWELFSELPKGQKKPVEMQPPTQVAFYTNQYEVLELTSMSRCYWMCLQHLEGEERIPLVRNINETEDEFRLRIAEQMGRAKQNMKGQKLQPRLDYMYMDKKWIPDSRKRGIVKGVLKGKGWPGSEYWVCLHFPGTGQVETKSKSNRYGEPVLELRISHKQVWYARAAYLGRLVQVHSVLPGLLAKYRKGMHDERVEKALRQKTLNAFSEIDRYTNDLNDLGTVTIDRQMDVVQSDMTVNAHTEQYQIFYRKDFQNVIGEEDGVMRTSDQDVWGKVKYTGTGFVKKYGHGAVKAMEEVFTDQSLSKHQTYIRRVKPKVNQKDLQDPVQSVSLHWNERANLWSTLFGYLHTPILKWERMHFEFHNSKNAELNKKLGISGTFHQLIKQIMFLNGGFAFAQVPMETTYYMQKIINVVQEKSHAEKVVKAARDFFDKGLEFFNNAYEAEKELKNVFAFGPNTSDEDKYMLYNMMRYKPAGTRGKTIRYILRCLYNGKVNDKKAPHTEINSDGSDFFDWGTNIRKTFFKFCMYYGLLIQRKIIDNNKEFEIIYRDWETIRTRSYKSQDVPLNMFESIWETGSKALTAVKTSEIWQIKIFDTGDITNGEWQSFDAHPLETIIDGKVLSIYPNRDLPLLFKTKESAQWKGREILRWKSSLVYWFIYLKRLEMFHIDSANYSRGPSVYRVCKNLMEKHITFLVAYLPEYRVYSDELYGPLVFGRLLNPGKTTQFDGAVLHIIAYCKRLKLEQADGKIEDIDEDLTCMQWTVNGFNKENNMNVWLTGTKNILTQTITKNPINEYGPNALTPEQEAALRDIYDKTGNQVRKNQEEAILEYRRLRTAQEKTQEAVANLELQEQKVERQAATIEKKRLELDAKIKEQQDLIDNVKRHAVENPKPDQ